MKRKSENYHFDPKHALPPEVVKNLREVLRFHDDVMRGIMAKLAMVPGLTDLIDGLSNALNACKLSQLSFTVRSLTPAQSYTQPSPHTSQCVFLGPFNCHRTHQHCLAGPYPGHQCHWRGFLRCHILRRPVGGEFQYHVLQSHAQGCPRCLTTATLLTRLIVSSPRYIEHFCGGNDPDFQLGPLRYHPERAGRQGREGCRRALRKSRRSGL